MTWLKPQFPIWKIGIITTCRIFREISDIRLIKCLEQRHLVNINSTPSKFSQILLCSPMTVNTGLWLISLQSTETPTYVLNQCCNFLYLKHFSSSLSSLQNFIPISGYQVPFPALSLDSSGHHDFLTY